MSTVVNKIESILTSEYSTTNYVELMQEIFNDMKLVAPNNFKQEFSNFSTHIVGKTHIGNYTTPEGKKIAIFSVQLKKENYVESSRSTQRSYAKKLIEGGNCDAAIVAFYTEGESKWRLSFVRLDYEMKIEQGKLKTTENITPAKRYSFLVGKDEPSHTAIERFRQFIINQNSKPSLDELEEAFSVEKVTKEFFEQYKEKFYQLQDCLESNQDFKDESNKGGFTSEQFAKKLLGQIVFLYFLQKKGWLGVKVWPKLINHDEFLKVYNSNGVEGRIIQKYLPKLYECQSSGVYQLNENCFCELSESEEEIIAKNMPFECGWGCGSNSFLRDLFVYSVENNLNFYDDCLEPLFYNAINKNRGDFSYFKELHCRIPFLSGGLFEPIDSFDWENSHITIPNELFSNKCIYGERNSTGILDVFDRFNFTVCEDEPMEREIAIDPEMLGKIFENLLEIRDRKSKGAFYTPREIVHYMCQESLINYLIRKTGLSEDALRSFILYGDFMKDEDNIKSKYESNGGMNISPELFEIDENANIVVNKLKDIDDALASVCILDPAVGSGAFLIGMLNEIVRTRQNITPYLLFNLQNDDMVQLITQRRTSYALKYHTIKESLFAVDIEPSAVDIARLRLWLSLVIDENVHIDSTCGLKEHRSPSPLPNLDSNIICGDSLIDKVTFAHAFEKSGIVAIGAQAMQSSMHNSPFIDVFTLLKNEKEKLFECTDSIMKTKHKHNILSHKSLMLESNETIGINKAREKYMKKMLQSSVPFTIWQLEFAHVFFENGGFDIVIGNPPYVQLQKSLSEGSVEKIGDKYSEIGYKTFTKKGDLYCLFFELGLALLCNGGCLSFITSNKWLRTEYGKLVRNQFALNNPIQLIDFSGTKVFETAEVDVNITLLQKSNNLKTTKVCSINRPLNTSFISFINQNSSVMYFTDDNIWSIHSIAAENIKNKILAVGKPISQWNININYGIKTCCNEVYVIDSATKEKLCDEDPKSIELMRPVLKGRDINKWECCHKDLWLLFVHNGNSKQRIKPVDINKYVAVKGYMSNNIKKLSKRSDKGITDYHLRDCAYIEDFSYPKIIFQEMVQSPSFAFDSKGEFMCLDTARIVTGEHLEYLTALFNSNVFFYAVKHFFGGGMLGAKGVRMKHTFFKDFPVYEPSFDEEEYIKALVLSSNLNRDILINSFFYNKYNLTPEDVAYIEKDIRSE